ncbi:hypothetical protein LTR36_007884 [Oleoguttula mirabilis]|uniref:Uncharacterized protein n=1 Tax=Oleoguttula mirabilis TaxID=1507867 RepID=A0AAV9J907_9PEZI|nr:hypothetical protein LTR36_007884 [Oleoguttula mirabilis]
MNARFSSLLPDETGKSLIEYLGHQKQKLSEKPPSSGSEPGIPLSRISWAWTETQDQAGRTRVSFTCFNEFRPESEKPNLATNSPLNRMDTFAVTVSDPAHIRPTLDMLAAALERAPNQRRRVRFTSDCKWSTMLTHCSADCEFAKLPRDLVEGKTRQEVSRLVDTGAVEELCSVLTIGVGRHFFLMFNVLHMLENANEHTVPALEMLFRETIFDETVIKLWWNLQSDFHILDNTIAHMYQLTARKPYLHKPHKSRDTAECTITPVFRLASPHFERVRPDDLTFSSQYIECDLHEEGYNEQGLACVCRLGNIDIGPLLNHFCRLHGLWIPKMSWNEHRHYINYANVLDYMLGWDRLSAILTHMKDRAGSTEAARQRFYSSLGRPGMEKDDDAMAYNIGDVAGVNLIFEELFASDDKRFIAGALNKYYEARRNGTFCTVPRRLGQKASSRKSSQGIPLFEDNPKLFTCGPFEKKGGKDCLTPVFSPHNKDRDEKSWTWTAGRSSRTRLWQPQTSTLSFSEHDDRVSLSRKLAGASSRPTAMVSKRLYKPPPTEKLIEVDARRKMVLHDMLDPSRFWVPQTMAKVQEYEHAKPIVRAGQKHAEALVEFLASSQANKASPPPGFGAPPGSYLGLPSWLHRVPGKGLELARDIFEGFQCRTEGNPKLLRDVPLKHGRVAARLERRLTDQEILDAALGTTDEPQDVWDAAYRVERIAEVQAALETELNENYGRPYEFDPADIFDPEGREYRRRIETSPIWNRPKMHQTYETGHDGSWRSLATATLALLNREVPKENDEQWAGWTVVQKKNDRKGY